MEETKRLAAIDIGTNSIRCLVVEATPTGDYRLLDDEKATVRLGEGMQASGRISKTAWERARVALKRMREIADGLGVVAIEAVATSAVRKAKNGAAFVAVMKEEAGVEVQVISGEEEAELAILSARHNFSMGSSHYALVDIGGGSAELVFATGEAIQDVASMELGAVFLSETFLRHDPVTGKELKALRAHIRSCLQKAFSDRSFPPRQYLIGSGGTITSIGTMLMAQRKEGYDSVDRYEVLHSDVVHLLAMLERMPCRERRSLSGLSPERADIIVAGVVLVEELMRFLGTNILRINERGIREGLILRGLDRHDLLAASAA
ncbi:MAG: Ppx/GppA family phosphatase, partial [Desulfuromonas sp.]